MLLKFFFIITFIICYLPPTVGCAPPSGKPHITISPVAALAAHSDMYHTNITITDPTGIASCSLSLNSKDITDKTTIIRQTPGRDTIELSLSITPPLALNILIISATNNGGETGTKVQQIKREQPVSTKKQNIIRKVLYHMLKRLF